MAKLLRAWVSIALAASLLGCVGEAPAATSADVELLPGLGFEYAIEGIVPIQAPFLMSPEGATRLRFEFGPGTPHLDHSLRRHETFTVTISTSGERPTKLADLSVAKDSMGLVQVVLFDVLPDGFGESVIVRDGEESWCAFGSVFYQRALRLGEVIAVPVPGGFVEFEVEEKVTLGGRSAFHLVATNESTATQDVWIDPALPCPVRVEGPDHSMTLSTQLAPESARPPSAGRSLPDVPPPVLLAAQEFGTPPDGGLPVGVWPLSDALSTAKKQDAPFRDFVARHPDAAVVLATHSRVDWGGRTFYFWSLLFADGHGFGYELKVQREVIQAISATASNEVIRSRPWTPDEPYTTGDFLTEGHPSLSFGSAISMHQALIATGVYSFEYRVFPGGGLFLTVEHAAVTTSQCELVGCVDSSRLASISFVSSGQLVGYNGPLEDWRG